MSSATKLVEEEVRPRGPQQALFDIGGVLVSNRSIRFGMGVLVLLLVGSVIASVALPSPTRQDLSSAFLAPGSEGHLLGTDPLGRDLLAWIAGGVRVALTVGVCVAVLSAIFGTLVGLVAGFFGGLADTVLMRLVDLQLAVPPLLLFIAASAVLTPSKGALILLLATVGWVPYARLVRTTVLSERERAYIAAARLAGSSPWRTLVNHLVPAASTSVLVLFSLQVGYVLLWESGLSFLGLGIRPPSTSLGYMISEGRTVLVEAWWVAVFPGITIVALVLAFNSIGDGLRDVFQLDAAPTRAEK
jgi:peptide/nickel transport system permease protein